MKRTDEKGVALILVMIMLAVLSIIAASLMSISRSETYASMNYRMMSTSRYGAESAVHKTANYLMSTAYTATEPGTASDPLTNYVLTGTPVTAGGQPVVLSSDPGTTSNYPVSAVATAFLAAASGSVSSVNYTATATLISMRQLMVFGGLTAVIQTWEIAGRGSQPGSRPALVEVSSILERQVVPTFRYAAFATDPGCGALTWSGGGNTASYDSTQVVGGVATISLTGGNVGTNGNLDVNGATTTINGSLSTPRSGVGGCSAGAVTAMTGAGSSIQGAPIELPQDVVYPPPALPNPPPPSGPTGDLTVNNGANLTKTPASQACPNPYASQGCYGDVAIKGTLHLTAGTYNINRLTMNAGGALIIDSGPVVLNIAGYATPGNPAVADATPVNMTGGSLTTSANLDPTMFQLMYAGSGDIKMAGGSTNAGLIYAPNALVENLSNGADWYGAVIGKKVKDAGAASILYDRQLQKKMMTLGAYMLDSFTWKKQ